MEIKMQYSDIEQVLSQLKASTDALQTSFPSDVASNNVLDVVNKLNSINESLQSVTEAYKSLLLKNIESTKQSVKYMQDTDTYLSSYMK